MPPADRLPAVRLAGLSLDPQDVTVAASRMRLVGTQVRLSIRDVDGHPLDVLLLTPAAARRLAIVLEAIAAEEM